MPPNYPYRIQALQYDCTGCELRVRSFPADALQLREAGEDAEAQAPHWDSTVTRPDRGGKIDQTAKSSQSR